MVEHAVAFLGYTTAMDSLRAAPGMGWMVGFFASIARIRRASALHPEGAVFAGELFLPDGWPGERGPVERKVVVRMSKGLGLPGVLPDVLGLAIRIPEGAGRGRPVDLLLSTTGSGRLTRWLPTPRRDWRRHAVYGSVMPFQTGRGLLSVAAIPDRGSTPLPALTDAVPFAVSLLVARPMGRWQAWGRLVITEHLPGIQISFDPILNAHPHLIPVPRVLSYLRKLAYAGSRRGTPGVNSQT